MNAGRAPTWVRAVLREGRRQRVSRIVAADAAAARALRALLRGSSPPGRVTVGIRALEGRSVQLRSHTTDAEVAVATFAGGYHLPPPELGALRSIWDIGANIGLTTADLAERHPLAHVLALEPHPENFALAIANVAPYADRCTMLQSAAWSSDGRVGLQGEDGPQDGYRASDATSANLVEAVSLNTLLARHGAPDYVKIDVEGGESELLRNGTQWSVSVRCVSVECHPPYGLAACVSDLERLGFRTRAFPQSLRRRARECVIGVRDPAGGG
jgi:FkbM family methyltransferase